MTNIILSGCAGKMGRVITDCVAQRDDCKIVAGVDLNLNDSFGYPVYDSIDKVTESADAIIDFSHPSWLDGLLRFSAEKKLPLVLATTGFSATQTDNIKAASKDIPLFFTFNMSLGINLLVALSKKAAAVLDGNFDIEIIEKHHNQKIDAPSGTAIMLAEAINATLDNRMMYEYDRHSKREKRPANEIGIHSIRGGNIVGEHEVLFAGHDEVITLSHRATSKEVFAVGAIKAALYMKGKTPGLYDMNNVIAL
ncbi:MAG: 4-hydroxy-tetrahydrodipicolinate reductase [Clostridia bacterium]|nr:4-hydroxy-tetrahydrodipicolinate reductase [Clostridia bacterium]